MSDDHKDLMKKLVEAPYGKAQEILKAKGLWDEKRCSGDPEQVKVYRVRVNGEMSVSAFVKVEAVDEDEACEKAADIACERRFSWSEFGEVDFVDAEVAERLL